MRVTRGVTHDAIAHAHARVLVGADDVDERHRRLHEHALGQGIGRVGRMDVPVEVVVTHELGECLPVAEHRVHQRHGSLHLPDRYSMDPDAFIQPGKSETESLAQSIETAYAKLEKKPDILVCSYHGVPERYLREGDPYHCQCQKTTRLLRERLGWDKDRIVTTFQSRFGPEEWLKPYTVEEVARLAKAGVRRLAVCAPAFSADCIETLEEINEEIRESFEHAGGEEFTYIPCLNADDAHVEALSGVIRDNLRGWLD